MTLSAVSRSVSSSPQDAARAREALALTVELSPDQLDAVAERVAALLAPPSAGSPWLGAKAAAEYIDAPVSRIHDLVQLRKLVPRRDGRRLLFHRDDLDAYLEAST
jgi:excisionase family DNA binding protein